MPTLLKSFESGYDQDAPIGDLGNDEYNWAQSFTLDSTATVDRVDLYLKKVNSISSNITVRIETDAAGPKPSGTLANASATTTITAPTNTTYDWKTATFSSSFSLTGSTKYWIVVSVPSGQSTNDHYDWAQDSGNGYAGHGSSASVNGAAYGNESATVDSYFRVYEIELTTTSTTTSTTTTSTSTSTTTTSTSTTTTSTSSSTTVSTSSSTSITTTSTSTTTTSTSTTTTSTSTTTTSTSTSSTTSVSTSTTTSDSLTFYVDHPGE